MTGGSLVECPRDLLVPGILGEDAAGPGAKRLERIVVLAEGGEDQDGARRLLGDDSPRRRDSVEHRHVQIQQHDVGPVSRDEFERLGSVCGRGDDVHIRKQAEHRRESLAHDLLIVDDEYPQRLAHEGTSALTVQPSGPGPAAR